MSIDIIVKSDREIWREAKDFYKSINVIGIDEHSKFEDLCYKHRFDGPDLLEFHKEFIGILRGNYDYFSLDEEKFGRQYPSNEGGGIYFCCRTVGYSGNHEVWYVGKTNNFAQRWKNHHKREALKAIKHVKVYMINYDFNGSTAPDVLLGIIEDLYISMLNPAFNGSASPDRHLRVAS